MYSLLVPMLATRGVVIDTEQVWKSIDNMHADIPFLLLAVYYSGYCKEGLLSILQL